MKKSQKSHKKREQRKGKPRRKLSSLIVLALNRLSGDLWTNIATCVISIGAFIYLFPYAYGSVREIQVLQGGTSMFGMLAKQYAEQGAAYAERAAEALATWRSLLGEAILNVLLLLLVIFILLLCAFLFVYMVIKLFKLLITPSAPKD